MKGEALMEQGGLFHHNLSSTRSENNHGFPPFFFFSEMFLQTLNSIIRNEELRLRFKQQVQSKPFFLSAFSKAEEIGMNCLLINFQYSSFHEAFF